jgi:phosphatidylcholine synthase
MTEFQQSADKPSMGQSAGRFAIHILTASGAALAFLALLAAVDRAWPAMFLWLGIAAVLPRWSGDTLDLVVDFVTYVFVPAFAIANSGLLPKLLAPVAGVAIVVTGAIYFADRQMKMPGNYFRGFPAIWNTAAFYLLLLRPSPFWSAVAVAALAVATFLPFPFIHPLRVARLRPITIALLVLWGVLALITLGRDMSPGPWISIALCAIALYVVGLGALRRS